MYLPETWALMQEINRANSLDTRGQWEEVRKIPTIGVVYSDADYKIFCDIQNVQNKHVLGAMSRARHEFMATHGVDELLECPA